MLKFAPQLPICKMRNHNISDLVIFLVSIVAMFNYSFQTRNEVIDRPARV